MKEDLKEGERQALQAYRKPLTIKEQRENLKEVLETEIRRFEQTDANEKEEIRRKKIMKA